MKYLITNVTDTNFNKKIDKVIFIDEYIENLYLNMHFCDFSYSTFYKIKDLVKINYNSRLLHKKIHIYRHQLSKVLNKIHNTNLSKRYWGLIIDQFIYLNINAIIINYKLLSKIKKYKKKIFLCKKNFSNYYYDSFDFVTSYLRDNRDDYIKFIIAKNIGFQIRTIKKKNDIDLKKDIKFNSDTKGKFYVKLIRYFVNFYINLFKPKLILDGYFSKSDILKIFIKSFGKILCIPSTFLFDQNKFIHFQNKNLKLRDKIQIKEKDFFDKIFNILIKKFIPLSYLENFSIYKKQSEKLSYLPLIGTAVSLIYNDKFKYLAAEILKKNGKLVTFQHGGLVDKEKYDYDELIIKRYSTKNFSWHGANQIKENFFNKLKTYDFNTISKKDKLLIYPSRMYLKNNYKNPLCIKYHPYLNLNYKFYESLKNNLKSKIKIKLFPEENSIFFKNYWSIKYKITKDIFIDGKKDLFNDFRIIVIDDVSTAICELLFTKTPFILICNEFDRLKRKTYKKVLDLKKINILFEDPSLAANFLNHKYESIKDWWYLVKKNKIYQDLRKELITKPTKNELHKLI